MADVRILAAISAAQRKHPRAPWVVLRFYVWEALGDATYARIDGVWKQMSVEARYGAAPAAKEE